MIHQASPSEWLAGWLAGSAQSEFFRSRFQGPLGASFHCPGGSDNHLLGKEASESRHPRPPPPVSVSTLSTQGRCQPSRRGPWHPLTLTDPRPSPGRCSSSFSPPLPAGHCLPAAGPVPLHSPPVSLGARQAFPSPKPFPAETPRRLEVPRALAGWTKFTRQN